jgi:hypothetical protein
MPDAVLLMNNSMNKARQAVLVTRDDRKSTGFPSREAGVAAHLAGTFPSLRCQTPPENWAGLI